MKELNKFEVASEKARALGKAYSNIKELQRWISDEETDIETGESVCSRPKDVYCAVEYDTYNELLKMIEKAL